MAVAVRDKVRLHVACKRKVLPVALGRLCACAGRSGQPQIRDQGAAAGDVLGKVTLLIPVSELHAVVRSTARRAVRHGARDAYIPYIGKIATPWRTSSSPTISDSGPPP